MESGTEQAGPLILADDLGPRRSGSYSPVHHSPVQSSCLLLRAEEPLQENNISTSSSTEDTDGRRSDEAREREETGSGEEKAPERHLLGFNPIDSLLLCLVPGFLLSVSSVLLLVRTLFF